MVLKEIMPLGGYQGFLKCRFAAKFIARAALKGRTVDGDEDVSQTTESIKADPIRIAGLEPTPEEEGDRQKQQIVSKHIQNHSPA